jgi:hypothetical protein
MEVDTDRQQEPIIDALGDDFDELLSIVEAWIGALVDAHVYPRSIEQFPPAWGRLDSS